MKGKYSAREKYILVNSCAFWEYSFLVAQSPTFFLPYHCQVVLRNKEFRLHQLLSSEGLPCGPAELPQTYNHHRELYRWSGCLHNSRSNVFSLSWNWFCELVLMTTLNPKNLAANLCQFDVSDAGLDCKMGSLPLSEELLACISLILDRSSEKSSLLVAEFPASHLSGWFSRGNLTLWIFDSQSFPLNSLHVNFASSKCQSRYEKDVAGFSAFN